MTGTVPLTHQGRRAFDGAPGRGRPSRPSTKTPQSTAGNTFREDLIWFFLRTVGSRFQRGTKDLTTGRQARPVTMVS